MSCLLSACACGARSTLSFLPVEEKPLAARLRWPFSPACRATGRLMNLRWAFPPACREKDRLMDLVCACDRFYPLPVEEKTVPWTWRALAIGFSTCLSRKSLSHGLGVRLQWAFPSICRGKGLYGPSRNHQHRSGNCVCPLPVEEKASFRAGSG